MVYFEGDRQVRESKPCRIARLPARDSVPLTLEARQVESFNRYEIQVEHSGQRVLYAGRISDATPSFKSTESLKKPAAKDAPRVTAEVCGVKWVDRDPLDAKEGEPGDIPFLRLKLRRNGKETYPSGKAQLLLYQGDKPSRYLNLELDDKAWAQDAGEIHSRSARPQMMAYDALTGELWIGLLRMDHAKNALRVTVTLTLEDGGTWEWKELDKAFTSPGRGPDR